jgi:hypothetical protein
VDDQRDVAVGAAPVTPARAAGQPGREAAPVDHHDRLGTGRAHRLQSAPGHRVQRPRAWLCIAHVEHLDRGQEPSVDSARQLQPRQLQPGLGPRRRGAGYQGRAAFLGPGAGPPCGRRSRGLLLLVGLVVLLVDHDQAEVAEAARRRGAGADADARLAALQPPPLVVALAEGQSGVKDRDAIAEPGPKAGHRLRREADLGTRTIAPRAPRQRGLDRGQIDLGLARPGDPVEGILRGGPGGVVEGGDDLHDGRALARRAAAARRSAGSPAPPRSAAAVASCGWAIRPRSSRRAGPDGRRRPRGQLAGRHLTAAAAPRARRAA